MFVCRDEDMKSLQQALLLCLLALTPPALADVEVKGLFKNAALLAIDGEQKLVKAGQTWKGVTVVEANSREVIVSLGGERQTLTVSSRIHTNFEDPATRTVRIPKNANAQYITNAEINGRRSPVLVDTGANIIAMNMIDAARLGVSLPDQPNGRVATASGMVAGYTVFLDSVDVGGIKVHNVQATVLSGNFPQTILLGMSYLRHVKMEESDGILLLTSKY
jgi:aspartyl protease family protein